MADLNSDKQKSLFREQHRGPAKKSVLCIEYSFAVLSVYIASVRNIKLLIKSVKLRIILSYGMHICQ